MPEPIGKIADLKLGEPRTAMNLTVIPLSGNSAGSLDYLLLDEAIGSKQAVVEEVSEGGSVPELRLTNFSDRMILIIDGSELVGAKQNRIVNASLMIPPKSITKIPVSCVEQGRWRYRTRNFESSKYIAAQRLRKENVDYQKTTLKQSRGYASNQGKIWADVADLSAKIGAHSETGAMCDAFEQRKRSLGDYSEKIGLEGWESGAAFFIGRSFEGLELLDRTSTFGKLFPKLLAGMAVEAMVRDMRETQTPDCRAEIKSILDEIGNAFFEKYTPIGVGEDWRYDGKHSFGKALFFEGDLIHLSAFGK